jgi:hypothetical protein
MRRKDYTSPGTHPLTRRGLHVVPKKIPKKAAGSPRASITLQSTLTKPAGSASRENVAVGHPCSPSSPPRRLSGATTALIVPANRELSPPGFQMLVKGIGECSQLQECEMWPVLHGQGLRNVTGTSWQQMWPLLLSHYIRFPCSSAVIGFSAPTRSQSSQNQRQKAAKRPRELGPQGPRPSWGAAKFPP